MTPETLTSMLNRLPQASSTELLRMDLQLRLSNLRDDIAAELAAESEAHRLDDPEPDFMNDIPVLAPANNLCSFVAWRAHLGNVTHIVVGRAVYLDMLANTTTTDFTRTKHLPAGALVQGFFDRIPLILDRKLADGGFIRYENELFESIWVELMVTR